MTKNIIESKGCHPRNYISYSQLVCWERTPELYKRKYFHGEQQRTNRGQALGKQFAEAIEHDKESGDLVMDIVIAQFPKFEIRDKEILANMSVGKGRDRKFIHILIKPDTTQKDYKAFKEYKTGDVSTPWTQKRVDEDDQMTFYFTGLYLKIKELGGTSIPTGELVWAPTEKVVGEDGVERPQLTGDIKWFPTTRDIADILRMQARISTAWREIGQAMESEIL
ncbi:MAG: hypothetical protein V4481_05195 [Patescibacteria group bacterium]